ncbi:MAG TPA: hypothetical protein VK524_20510 [Polyangiaceae bacterium]|nr:hypothetical protein [Polyangiaceae bacterium]
MWKHVGVGALLALACFGAPARALADESPSLLVNPWTDASPEATYPSPVELERATWLEAPAVQRDLPAEVEELVDPWQERATLVPTGTFPPVGVVDPWNGSRPPAGE